MAAAAIDARCSTRPSTTPSCSLPFFPTTTVTTRGSTATCTRPRGFPQYSNVSGWDIYRTRFPSSRCSIPTSPTAWSSPSSATPTQDGGFLPRWQFVDVEHQRDGRRLGRSDHRGRLRLRREGFDASAALAAMVHGADTPTTPPPPPPRLYRAPRTGRLSRPRLRPHQHSSGCRRDELGLQTTWHRSPWSTPSTTSPCPASPHPSVTVHRPSSSPRAHNWHHVFDPSTGLMAPRAATGASPPGWPTTSFSVSDNIAAHGYTGVGQTGFQEGNTNQYTWMVPQDLAVCRRPRRPRRGHQKLEQYFTKLNAGTTTPYDWAGNEPELGTPYVGDYSGVALADRADHDRDPRPALPRQPRRRAGERRPRGDELLGGVDDARPLPRDSGQRASSSSRRRSLPQRTSRSRRPTPDRQRESTRSPERSYISAMTVDGKSSQRPWLPASALTTGATVDEHLVAQPDHEWGSAPADAPPSYGPSSPASPLHRHVKRQAGHSRAG